MDNLIYILKIFCFFLMIFIMYKVAKKTERNKKKLSWGAIILLSTLIGLYSFVCTAHPFVMDKEIYAIKFENDIYSSQVKNESLGLWMLEKTIHIFTYNPNIFFFIVAFFYAFITLVAYRKARNASALTMLLLGLSEYFFFGYYQLKQCIAVAIVTLALVEYENGYKIKSLILVILAIFFHESALIIIPTIIIWKGTDKKVVRVIGYISLICCTLFFNHITSLIIKIVINNVPFLAEQLSIYISEGSIITSKNIFTIFKGVPFYFVTIYGIVKRKEYLNKIEDYDKYLMLSCFTCFTIILSYYMYWMFRLGTYYYMNFFILATQIYGKIENKKLRKFYLYFEIMTLAGLALKLWMQYYFIYGGI